LVCSPLTRYPFKSKKYHENLLRVVGFTVGNAGGNIPKAFVKNAAASALPKFIASAEKTIKNKKW
jgi:hypothetical protein